MRQTIREMIHWPALRHGCIIAPNWLGDAVMSLPALQYLLQQTPDCTWTVLARPAVAPIYRATGWPLQVWTLPVPGRGWQRLKSLLAARQLVRDELRNAPGPQILPQILIVLPNSFYSGALARTIGAPIRLGYARDGRGWLLTHAIACPQPGETPPHESYYSLELLRRAGLIDQLPERTEVRLHPAPEHVAAMRRRLQAGGDAPVVAIHAGATFGTAKRWLPERFAALAARLAQYGIRVVLLGSPAERGLAGEVCAEAQKQISLRSGTVPLPDPLNLAGETSLPEVLALLACVDLLVSNDSGPMHLAGAVGTPVLAIFGSTNERETYPLTQPGRFRLIKAPGIECSPCKLRECPIDHRCMTRIAVEEVLASTLEGLRHRGWEQVQASTPAGSLPAR